MRDQENIAKQPLDRADGVARSARPIGRSLKRRSAKSLGLKSFAELTTPSAALRRLRAFLLMPQPPLLFKEGNVSALKQSVNSFTRSNAVRYVMTLASRANSAAQRRQESSPGRKPWVVVTTQNSAVGATDLFMAERDQRVNAGRTPGGKIRCGESDSSQHYGHGKVSQRIGIRYSEQHSRHRASARNCAGEADRHAEAGQHQTLPHDHAQNLPCFRAQRHSQADLMRSL